MPVTCLNRDRQALGGHHHALSVSGVGISMCVTFRQPGLANLAPAPPDWAPERPVVPLLSPEQHHPEGPLWEGGGKKPAGDGPWATSGIKSQKPSSALIMLY